MDATDRGPRTTEAMGWLRAVLEHRPQYTTDILDAATEDGISHGTLRLAKTALGVVARKDSGQGGAWCWQMPADVYFAPEIERVEEIASTMTDVERDEDDEPASASLPHFDDVLLRAADIAGFLRVSKSRAYELMADGTLPSIRIGKSIRVSRKSLERWVRDQEGV